MGATTFTTVSRGATASEAFTNARRKAQHEYGHGGYTGTIAEKSGYRELVLPAGVTAKQALAWLDEGWVEDRASGFGGMVWTADHAPVAHRRWLREAYAIHDDKWGPALALKVADGTWVFAGWALE